MKFNKWTLGLAAVGAVSLASAARADETNMLMTSLSATTISGYVDVAAQYNVGNVNPGTVPAGTAFNKVDNISLNDVDIAFDKPEDESPWASGYHIELNYGTDAVGVTGNGGQAVAASGTAGLAIRQAYVVLRTPLGNGIDWKIGIQDDIIGYEGNTDGGNPNYTRSVGYFYEPTTLLGLIGSYKICNAVTVQAGIADATSPFVATSSDKTAAAAIALTAPDSWGWAKGATLNAGVLLNIENHGVQNYYAGLSLPTPISVLKVGASFDLIAVNNQAPRFVPGNTQNDSGWVGAVYATIQPTDKLSFNLRGEYYDLTGGALNPYGAGNGRGEEATATLSYSLWANVTSRVEARWDHVDSGDAFGLTPVADSFLVAANIIYTF